MPTNIDTNLFPLGAISPTPGTPLDLFQNFTDLRISPMSVVNMVLIQAAPWNKGKAYFGHSTLNVATNVGINFVLMNPGDSFSIGSNVLNIFDMAKYRVDVDVLGDSVIASMHIR